MTASVPVNNVPLVEARRAYQERGAVFSGDYRYLLWRTWNAALPRLLWVMLNPSTADAEHDDATIRRCVAFSRRWSYGSLEVANLFALRTTDPSRLRHVADPFGSENDRAIAEAASRAAGIVVAWGERGGYRGRDRAVLGLLQQQANRPLYCLGTVRNGQPRHPLYMSVDTNLYVYDDHTD